MSERYDLYLEKHKAGVKKAFEWLKENLPEVTEHDGLEWQVCYNHDTSKNDSEEYDAYDKYFYGGNKSYSVVQDFNYAWLRHIHMNPHHWQHWVLINDDPTEGEKIMDMPYIYVVEMICDWWSFSFNKGNLDEIFSWYDEHSKYMKLSKNTRNMVEDILNKIKAKLEEENNG